MRGVARIGAHAQERGNDRESPFSFCKEFIVWVVFLLMVAIPWVRAFFSLAVLNSRAYLLIGGAAILWGLLQRWLWRIHFLERFLALE